MSSGQTREYAMVVILSPEATESETEDTIKRILRYLPDLGGTISRWESLGIQPLHYPVHHFNKAGYLVIGFDLDTQVLEDLKGVLNSDQDILWHQIRNLTKTTTTSFESKIVNQPYPETIIELIESWNAAIEGPVSDEYEDTREQGLVETTVPDGGRDTQEFDTGGDAEEDSGGSVGNQSDIGEQQVTESDDLKRQSVAFADPTTEMAFTGTSVPDDDGETKEIDAIQGGDPVFAVPVAKLSDVEECEATEFLSEDEDQVDLSTESEDAGQESVQSAVAGDEGEEQETNLSEGEEQGSLEPAVAQDVVEDQEIYVSEDGEPEPVATDDGNTGQEFPDPNAADVESQELETTAREEEERESVPPATAQDVVEDQEIYVSEDGEPEPVATDDDTGQELPGPIDSDGGQDGSGASSGVSFAQLFFQVQTETPAAASENTVVIATGGPNTTDSARSDTEQSGQSGRLGSRVARVVTRWKPTSASEALSLRFNNMVYGDYGRRCQICGSTFRMQNGESNVSVVHIVPPSEDFRTNNFGNLLGLCGWHYALMRHSEWAFLNPESDQPFQDWEEMRESLRNASSMIDDEGNEYVPLPVRFFNVYQGWSSTPETADEAIRYSIPHQEYLRELLST